MRWSELRKLSESLILFSLGVGRHMSILLKIINVCAVLVCLSSANAFAAALRYDGVYRYHEPSEDFSFYLRFYSDGTALSTASAEAPDKIVEWFHRGSKAGSRGEFTVRESQLRFTTFGFESRNDCVGSIEDVSLVLKCGDSDVAMRFEFVPMRLAQ
jgi:hypothetical protein